jgi:hypothetical protein
MTRSVLRYALVTTVVLAVVSGVLFMITERTGTVSSTEELNIGQAEKKMLLPLRLSKPIVFWMRPFFRPCTAILASNASESFRTWQTEYCSNPMDKISIRAIDYWIERLKPSLPESVMEELSKRESVESCQVNLEGKNLQVFFIPNLEKVLIVIVGGE